MWDYQPIHHFLRLASISKQGREMGKFWLWGFLCMWKGSNSLLRQRVEVMGKCWRLRGGWGWVSCDCLYKKWIGRAGGRQRNYNHCNFHLGEPTSKNGGGEDWSLTSIHSGLSLPSWINSETAQGGKLRKLESFCKHNVLIRLHCKIRREWNALWEKSSNLMEVYLKAQVGVGICFLRRQMHHLLKTIGKVG